MTLAALARAAAIAKSTVSDLEHAQGNPSLETLWSLANALNVPFAVLFDEDEGENAVRVRRLADAPVIAAEGINFVSQHLVARQAIAQLEVNVVSLTAGTRRDSPAHGLGIVEHVMPLDGSVNAGPDDQPHVLSAGDLLTFHADQPHHYHALEKAVRIVVMHEYPRGNGLTGTQSAGTPMTDARADG